MGDGWTKIWKDQMWGDDPPLRDYNNWKFVWETGWVLVALGNICFEHKINFDSITNNCGRWIYQSIWALIACRLSHTELWRGDQVGTGTKEQLWMLEKTETLDGFNIQKNINCLFDPTKFYCSITCRCDLHGARGRLIGNVTKSVYDGDLETILWAKYEGYCWWIDEDVLENLIFVVYGWIFRKPRNQFPVKSQLLKRDSPVSANRLKCPVNWEREIKS